MLSHSRRRFLSIVARGAAAAPFASALPSRAVAAASGVPRGMIVRNDMPEHWESSLAALDDAYLTPREQFFVRSHLGVPTPDPKAFRLEVAGLVERPLSLSLAELRALPHTTRDATLECAGNGRARYGLPSSSGTQWELGAVGNARWTGVSMAEVLNRAGLKHEAQHVWLECLDQAPVPGVPPFLRSIPLNLALGDAMLAWNMNAAPLSPLHGAPLRAIVPGWFAMASAKWVTRLRVADVPSDNHFMVRGYRYNYPGVDPTAAAAVEHMAVKSLVTRPLDGAHVHAGALEARGIAWCGRGVVQTVETSLDDGATWSAATLIDPARPGAWRRWTQRIAFRPGTTTLRVRATDSDGVMQPVAARANGAGYANNSIHSVTVHAS